MILDEIILEKKQEIASLKAERRSLKKSLNTKGLSLIAEIKKASPAKGLIRKNFQPEDQLEHYIKAGVDAVSILTDKKFFQGNNEILRNLRKRTNLPLLRKDFIIDPIQVYESFFLGADVILLIAAVLDQDELNKLLAVTRQLGLEAIVEVHNQTELERVLMTSAEIIGINNRNLKDFSVSLKTTEKLVEKLQKDNVRDNYYLIAESGIKSKSDIDYLKELGVDGVLVGETLMRSQDPFRKIKELGF